MMGSGELISTAASMPSRRLPSRCTSARELNITTNDAAKITKMNAPSCSEVKPQKNVFM